MNELEIYTGKRVDLEQLARELGLDALTVKNDTRYDFPAVTFSGALGGFVKHTCVSLEFVETLSEAQIAKHLSIIFGPCGE